MDELVIYKKGDNIMSCGFKLKLKDYSILSYE